MGGVGKPELDKDSGEHGVDVFDCGSHSLFQLFLVYRVGRSSRSARHGDSGAEAKCG